MAGPLRDLLTGQPVRPALSEFLEEPAQVVPERVTSALRQDAPLEQGIAQGLGGFALGASADDMLDAELARNQTAYEEAARAHEALQQRFAQADAQYAPSPASYRDVNTLGDAVRYGLRSFGQGSASMAPVLGGALAARFLGVNPYAGAALSGYNLEANEAIQNQYSDPAVAALSPEERLAAARAKGGINAALESVVPGMLGTRFLRPGGALRTLGTAALEESATEALQERVGQASQAGLANQTGLFRELGTAPTDAETEAIINAGIMGGLTGGGMSVPTAASQALANTGKFGLDKAQDLQGLFTSDPDAPPEGSGPIDLKAFSDTFQQRRAERAKAPPEEPEGVSFVRDVLRAREGELAAERLVPRGTKEVPAQVLDLLSPEEQLAAVEPAKPTARESRPTLAPEAPYDSQVKSTDVQQVLEGTRAMTADLPNRAAAVAKSVLDNDPKWSSDTLRSRAQAVAAGQVAEPLELNAFLTEARDQDKRNEFAAIAEDFAETGVEAGKAASRLTRKVGQSVADFAKDVLAASRAASGRKQNLQQPTGSTRDEIAQIIFEGMNPDAVQNPLVVKALPGIANRLQSLGAVSQAATRQGLTLAQYAQRTGQLRQGDVQAMGMFQDFMRLLKNPQATLKKLQEYANLDALFRGMPETSTALRDMQEPGSSVASLLKPEYRGVAAQAARVLDRVAARQRAPHPDELAVLQRAFGEEQAAFLINMYRRQQPLREDVAEAQAGLGEAEPTLAAPTVDTEEDDGVLSTDTELGLNEVGGPQVSFELTGVNKDRPYLLARDMRTRHGARSSAREELRNEAALDAIGGFIRRPRRRFVTIPDMLKERYRDDEPRQRDEALRFVEQLVGNADAKARDKASDQRLVDRLSAKVQEGTALTPEDEAAFRAALGRQSEREVQDELASKAGLDQTKPLADQLPAVMNLLSNYHAKRVETPAADVTGTGLSFAQALEAGRRGYLQYRNMKRDDPRREALGRTIFQYTRQEPGKAPRQIPLSADSLVRAYVSRSPNKTSMPRGKYINGLFMEALGDLLLNDPYGLRRQADTARLERLSAQLEEAMAGGDNRTILNSIELLQDAMLGDRAFEDAVQFPEDFAITSDGVELSEAKVRDLTDDQKSGMLKAMTGGPEIKGRLAALRKAADAIQEDLEYLAVSEPTGEARTKHLTDIAEQIRVLRQDRDLLQAARRLSSDGSALRDRQIAEYSPAQKNAVRVATKAKDGKAIARAHLAARESGRLSPELTLALWAREEAGRTAALRQAVSRYYEILADLNAQFQDVKRELPDEQVLEAELEAFSRGAEEQAARQVRHYDETTGEALHTTADTREELQRAPARKGQAEDDLTLRARQEADQRVAIARLMQETIQNDEGYTINAPAPLQERYFKARNAYFDAPTGLQRRHQAARYAEVLRTPRDELIAQVKEQISRATMVAEKKARFAGEKLEARADRTAKLAERTRLHAALDRVGVAWDNDQKFMDFTEAQTGKRHLDDLSVEQMVALRETVEDIGRSGLRAAKLKTQPKPKAKAKPKAKEAAPSVPDTAAQNRLEDSVLPSASPQEIDAAQRRLREKVEEDVRRNPAKQGLKFSKQSAARTPAQQAMAKLIYQELNRIEAGAKVRVVSGRLQVDGKESDAMGTYAPVDNEIQVSLMSQDPLGVGYHEALHRFFDALSKTEQGKRVRAMLQQASGQPHVRKQLADLLKDHPNALGQVESDPEERAAYLFQFWAVGKFTGHKLIDLSPAIQNQFTKILDYLREMLGLLTADERTLKVFDALYSGRLADRSTMHAVLADLKVDSLEDKLRRAAGPIADVYDKLLLTATDRLRAFQSAPLEELADRFATEPGREGGSARFLPRRSQETAKLTNRVAALFKDTTAAQRLEAVRNLQAMKPPSSDLERDVAALLKDVFHYMQRAGVKRFDPARKEWVDITPVNRYFPRKWDASKVLKNPDRFKALLGQYGGLSPAQQELAVKAVTHGDGHTELADNEYHVGFTPFAEGLEHRQFTFINPTNADKFAEFQVEDLADVLLTYAYQAIHRAEMAREFGNAGEQITTYLTRAASDLSPQQQAQANDAVKALIGTLGAGVNPRLKNLMGGLVTAQNVILLPLTIFNQFIDALGVGLRSGEVVDAWEAMKEGFKGLVRQGSKENEALAETLGLIDEQMIFESMGQAHAGAFMGKFSRDVNRKFFRWNGMEQWNRSMRVAAMVAGERFILRNQDNGRYMRELNLDKEDVMPLGNGRLAVTKEQMAQVDPKLTPDQLAVRERKVQEAVFRFVDGAVLRPNAAQRPVWGSDPHWMLMFHLKQFAFSFQKTILARTANEFDNGRLMPAAILAAYVPVTIASGLAKGLVTGQPIGDGSLWSALNYGIMRSGLLGTSSFGTDAVSDLHRGMLPGTSLLGPTIEHAWLGSRFLAGDPQIDAGRILDRSAPFARYF